MAARRHRSGVYVLVAFALALSAHLMFVVVAESLGWLDLIAALRSPHGAMPIPKVAETEQQKDDQPLEIQQLVDELQSPDEKSEEEKKREEEKKKEEEDKNPHGQVVDVAKPLLEEHPDKANYVSEFDTKVEHEMKMYGREQGGAKEGATPMPPSLPSGDAPNARPAQQPQVGKGGRPGPLAMRDLQKPQPRGAHNDYAPDRDGEKPRQGQNGGQQPLSPRQQVGDNGDGIRRTPGSEGPVGTPGQKHPQIMPTPPR